jgi:hypothetical protein
MLIGGYVLTAATFQRILAGFIIPVFRRDHEFEVVTSPEPKLQANGG